MKEILTLIILVLILVLLWSALCGAVAFFKDLNKFKSEIQFSGFRKELIEYLTEQERKEMNINADRPE